MSHSGCNHNHNHDDEHGNTHASGNALNFSLVITVVFVIVEAMIGLKARSLALVSDAGHNFSDALSLGLSSYAVWIARRPANSRKTFGYHRVAILAALLNSAALAVLSISIVAGAWSSFSHPHPIDSGLMLITAGFALVINTAIVFALHGGAKNSLNIRATYIHMATDVISSILVLTTAFIIHQTGLTIFDPIVSLIIAGIIFISCWNIIREATDILLEGSPRGLKVEKMVADIESIPHVQSLHDLHVWTVSDGLNYLSCHIEVDAAQTLAECAQITKEVNDLLRSSYSIAHATIQVEQAGACLDNGHSDDLYCGGKSPQHHSINAKATA
jgi:cobalt-zinc-cadmium efflux system protein